MITRREAERLVKSFLEDCKPPSLPENFTFSVYHKCGWGSKGVFFPSRYNSSRAKCIRCYYCNLFYSPNKFIFHAHNLPDSKYIQPDTANFNSWRRHLLLANDEKMNENFANAWEDVKAIFNGGTRKRRNPPNNTSNISGHSSSRSNSPLLKDENNNKIQYSNFRVDPIEMDSSCELINKTTSEDIEPIKKGKIISNSIKQCGFSSNHCEKKYDNPEVLMEDRNKRQQTSASKQLVESTTMLNQNAEYSLTFPQIMAIIAASNYPYFPLTDTTRTNYYPHYQQTSNILPYFNPLNILENQLQTRNAQIYSHDPLIVSNGNSLFTNNLLQKQQQDLSNNSIARLIMRNDNEEQISSKRIRLSNTDFSAYKPFSSEQNN